MVGAIEFIIPWIVLGCLGLLFGVLIAVLSHYLRVEKSALDEFIEAIEAKLPGYNCGACGHPGCSGLAKALAEGSGEISQCRPIKKADAQALEAFIKENKPQ